jgi:RNA polymerase sigma-70 factor (sigma-E family)
MRAADEDRFREFARGNAVMLRRYGYLLCGDWHLAEDLVQTTLYKMYGAWPRIRGTDRPMSYARRTLTRCWLDERRRPWRRSEHHTDALPEVADETADPSRHPAGLRPELATALAALAPRQRAVLVLRYFCDLPVADAARELRCSEGTVRSQTARALQTLRSVYPAESGFLAESELQ